MQNKIPTSKAVRGARAISIVSVALVLLILGTMGLTAFTARHVTTDLRERLGFVVVVDDEAGALAPDSLKAVISGAPQTASVQYRSAEEVRTRWIAEMGAGDEALSDLGINPFLPEFEVSVKEAWSSPDSIAAVAEAYTDLPWVYDVHVHDAIVSNVNATINTAMAIMTVMACALILISFALINNTVRLTIHSRRFAIQTMKYVGATDGFITRPIVGESTLHGLLAAAEAAVVLTAAVFYLEHIRPGVIEWITWQGIAWTVGGMFAAGAALCAFTSWIATRKYLRKHYEDLF